MILNIDERFRILESELTEFTKGGTLDEDWGKRLDNLGKVLEISPEPEHLERYERILIAYFQYIQRRKIQYIQRRKN